MFIVAIWMVQAEDYPTLLAGAQSDADIAGLGTEQFTTRVSKCSPLKIEGTRVTQWRGWAIVYTGNFDPELTLRTCFHEESSLAQGLSRSLARLDTSSSST